MKKNLYKLFVTGLLSSSILFSMAVPSAHAWEYLGVNIPDYINQEEVMAQVNAGNQNIIDQLCLRFGACPVKQEQPNIDDKREDVGDTSDAFTDQKAPENYVPPKNPEIDNQIQAEDKYNSNGGNSVSNEDYTGKLNDIMTNIITNQSSQNTGYVSNGSAENVYLQWLQNYSGDNKNGLTYTGSTFEAAKYFEYLQLARKAEATVKQYNVNSFRTFQYNLGEGFKETGIVTKADGYMSGLDVESLYEIIAREKDTDITVSALGVSIKNINGEVATALKTSIYKTQDIIEILRRFDVEGAVRVSRMSGNFSLVEYVESLPKEEQIITVNYGENKEVEVGAYVKDSTVLLDVETLVTAVGGTYGLSGTQVNVSRGNSSFSGNIDSTAFSLKTEGGSISGADYKLTAPVLKIDNVVYVSTYSLTKGLGYNAIWDTGEHALYLAD